MSAQRMLLLTFSAVISIGIYLTGFDKASWVLYVPASMALFAGITGTCPGLIFWKKCGLK
jgi:hypothetical protein